jgi:MmeI, target recognition domain/MmeI, C-terminal domain/MmeI, DNA-methyltransferase domain
LRDDVEIVFAHLSFKWSNSAARNAGVTCVIIGIAQKKRGLSKAIYEERFSRSVSHINAYLVEGADLFVESRPATQCLFLPPMQTGSVPNDGGNLILDPDEVRTLTSKFPAAAPFVHPFFGSEDYLQGLTRFCLVISDQDASAAREIEPISERLDRVAGLRQESKKRETREQLSQVPHRFQHRGDIPERRVIIVPSVSSERREWFPAGILPAGTVVSNLAFMIIDAALWNLALIASRVHLVWVATVCGKLKTDYRYSNTLGWNTFPVPTLTDKNKTDLTSSAEDILLAREAHFPATIADLYDPDNMPDDLRAAHERNDETLERIYIGRRFRNDTERLEKLFELYTKMVGSKESQAKGRGRKQSVEAGS